LRIVCLYLDLCWKYFAMTGNASIEGYLPRILTGGFPGAQGLRRDAEYLRCFADFREHAETMRYCEIFVKLFFTPSPFLFLQGLRSVY
jgi:hypothetical protein